MDNTVNKAFNGETPDWVKESDEQIAKNFLNEIQEYALKDTRRSYRTDYYKNNKLNKWVEGKYKDEEWGVDDASYIDIVVGQRDNDPNRPTFDTLVVFSAYESVLGKGNNEAYYMLIKNEGDESVRLKFHSVAQYEAIEPNETKLIAISGKAPDAFFTQVHVSFPKEGQNIKLKYYKPTVIRGKDNMNKVEEIKDKYKI